MNGFANATRHADAVLWLTPVYGTRSAVWSQCNPKTSPHVVAKEPQATEAILFDPKNQALLTHHTGILRDLRVEQWALAATARVAYSVANSRESVGTAP